MKRMFVTAIFFMLFFICVARAEAQCANNGIDMWGEVMLSSSLVLDGANGKVDSIPNRLLVRWGCGFPWGRALELTFFGPGYGSRGGFVWSPIISFLLRYDNTAVSGGLLSYELGLGPVAYWYGDSSFYAAQITGRVLVGNHLVLMVDWATGVDLAGGETGHFSGSKLGNRLIFSLGFKVGTLAGVRARRRY